MRKLQFGMTMIELVVTIVLLAIALVGVTSALNFSVNQSGNTTVEVRALALAQAYLDEILGRRYDENTRNNGIPPCRDPALIGVPPPQHCTLEVLFGLDAGEISIPYSRNRFDDVDDYHGLDEGDGGADPMVDGAGNPRTGYDNFRVEVDVRYINVAVPADEEFGLKVNNELNDQYDAKLITVTVTYRGLNQGFKFSAYKANF